MARAERRPRTARVAIVALSVLAISGLQVSISSAATSATFEAETLAGGTRVSDASASAGAFLRTRRVEATSALTSGVYRLRARVRTAGTTRVDLLSAGAMTGSWEVAPGSWRILEAVTWIGTSQMGGVASFVTSGTAPTIDVDWIQLVAAPLGYTVRGGNLLGMTGGATRFKGINLRGQHAPPNYGTYLDMHPSQAQDLYVWGADSVRIALNQEHWLANCTVRVSRRTTNYRTAIADEVRDITAKGMFVLLALSVTERGQATACREARQPLLKEMADTRSLSFWTSVAQTFASNARVAFDLFNEPRDISGGVWRNGGTIEYRTRVNGLPRTRTYRAVGMQQMYDVVRSTGATNPVFVSGYKWAADPRVALSWPLSGYGIVLASHVYCGSCGTSNPALPAGIDTKNSAAVRARHPLVMTEGGWGTQHDGRFNRMLINWANARAVPWMMYAFMRPDSYSLVREWRNAFDAGKGYYTKPPSTSGAPVWNSMAALRTARGYLAKPLAE
jgi:hypothetical protein